MISYTCECGARYKLPEGSEGKRAKCKKCGRIFTIPTQAAPVAPPDDDYWDFEKDAADSGISAAGGGAIPIADDGPGLPLSSSAMMPSASGSHAGRSPEELVAMGRADAATRATRGFWGDVAWTFLLFTELNNLIMLVIIWFLHAAGPLVTFAPCIGGICYIIVAGWLCSYCLKVVVEAANGEENLPTLGLTEGFLDDIIVPLLKFVAAGTLAWAPAIIYTVAVAWAKGVGVDEVIAGRSPVLLAISGLGMFLWPMLLLVIAVGGFSSVVRVDLILSTIVRTFLPYLAVCLLFASATALEHYAFALAALATGGGQRGLWIVGVIGALLQAYFGIVAMRIVGLYYHHFKNRFAWNWG